MGVGSHEVKLLLSAVAEGVSFERTITLGRQRLVVSQGELAHLTRGRMSVAAVAAVERGRPYADELFRQLGAREVLAMDASPYEGAGLIQDLNAPLFAQNLQHCGRATLVFDGGTIEHVFNLPAALANCMRLLSVGGHFVGSSPANNQCGHGFYQLSPELFHRAFGPSTGFSITKLILAEYVRDGAWFEALDPAVVGPAPVMSTIPLEILVIAKKTSEVAPFEKWPQQSFWESQWKRTARISHRRKWLKSALARAFPRVRSLVGALRGPKARPHAFRSRAS